MDNVTNLRQAETRLEVMGKLSEKALEETAVDGKNVIKGKLVLQTSDVNFVTLNVYVSEKTKNGSTNSAYEGLKTVMKTYKSVAEVGAEEATLVHVKKGQIEPQTYFDRTGQMRNSIRYKANYFTHITNPEEFEPKAEFEMEVYIAGMKDEVFSSGEQIGEPTGRKLVMCWVPLYNNGIEPITFIATEDIAEAIETEYEIGQTVKFLGDAVNNRVEKTREIPVKLGKPKIEKFSEYTNELIITGATDAFEDEKAYSEEIINKAIEERKIKLEEEKNKSNEPKAATKKATPKAGRPMPAGW